MKPNPKDSFLENVPYHSTLMALYAIVTGVVNAWMTINKEFDNTF